MYFTSKSIFGNNDYQCSLHSKDCEKMKENIKSYMEVCVNNYLLSLRTGQKKLSVLKQVCSSKCYYSSNCNLYFLWKLKLHLCKYMHLCIYNIYEDVCSVICISFCEISSLHICKYCFLQESSNYLFDNAFCSLQMVVLGVNNGCGCSVLCYIITSP